MLSISLAREISALLGPVVRDQGHPLFEGGDRGHQKLTVLREEMSTSARLAILCFVQAENRVCLPPHHDYSHAGHAGHVLVMPLLWDPVGLFSAATTLLLGLVF